MGALIVIQTVVLLMKCVQVQKMRTTLRQIIYLFVRIFCVNIRASYSPFFKTSPSPCALCATRSAPIDRLCLTERYGSELFGKAVWLSLQQNKKRGNATAQTYPSVASHFILPQRSFQSLNLTNWFSPDSKIYLLICSIVHTYVNY